MRVLITGGSGFIGTNLVEMYLSQGDEVANFDILKPRNPLHESYWHKVDILNDVALTSHMREFNPDVIFHMAARTDLNGKVAADYQENVLGVRNVIKSLKGITSLRRVIFASSRLVCKIGYMPRNEFDYCPSTPYGESKAIGEQIVRDAIGEIGCEALIVRPTSIWGPWFDIPYKTFFLTIANRQYFHPGAVRVLKSFGYVGNTVYELDKLMRAPSTNVHGKTFYLADYPSTEVSLMANGIQEIIGAPTIKSINISILKIAALFGDLLKICGWRNPPLTSFRLDNLLTPMEHDLNPLKELVGDLPCSMKDGIETTVSWMRSQGIIE